jgi:hypothetical protein
LRDLGELAEALAAREQVDGAPSSDPAIPVELAAAPAQEHGDVEATDTSSD